MTTSINKPLPARLSNMEFASEIKPSSEGTRSYRVALHRAQSGSWVTHIEILTEDGQHESYGSGHYFQEHGDAVLDYIGRCHVENLQA